MLSFDTRTNQLTDSLRARAPLLVLVLPDDCTYKSLCRLLEHGAEWAAELYVGVKAEMEETARIRVKHIERLTRNMHLDIVAKNGDTKRGYFKRFIARDLSGKNQYRGSISELQQLISGLSADQVGLFFTDSEQDPPKVQG